jgi:hypothetical protein
MQTALKTSRFAFLYLNHADCSITAFSFEARREMKPQRLRRSAWESQVWGLADTFLGINGIFGEMPSNRSQAFLGLPKDAKIVPARHPTIGPRSRKPVTAFNE